MMPVCSQVNRPNLPDILETISTGLGGAVDTSLQNLTQLEIDRLDQFSVGVRLCAENYWSTPSFFVFALH